MNVRSKVLRLIALAIGVAIFLFSVHSFGGFEVLVANLLRVKYFYAFVVLNSFLWMLFYTEAWRQMFKGLHEKVRYLALLKIKLAGEGVNFMTPLGFIAGDPVRLLLLQKLVGPEARLRSVVIDRVMHSFAAQVINVIGLSLIFTQEIDFPVWIHLSLLALYVVMSFFFFLLIAGMSSGKGFGPFESLINVLNLEQRLPKVDRSIKDLKENLGHFQDKSKRPFLLSFLLHFGGRVLGAVEIGIIFYCYTGYINFTFCFILISLTSFVSVAGGFIPGALGLLEGLYATFASLYGFSPEVGLSMQIVRRLRVLFWMAVGVLLLDYKEISKFLNKIKGKPLSELVKQNH